MDFTLPDHIEAYRLRLGAFVADEVIPLEGIAANFDAHEMIAEPVLEELRAKAKAAGLWAFQMPEERGGAGVGAVGMAACYVKKWRARRSGHWCSTAPPPMTAT